MNNFNTAVQTEEDIYFAADLATADFYLGPNIRFITDVVEVQQAHKFHQEARAALPEDEKYFLLPKTENYFRQLARKETGVLLGAFLGDALVGIISCVHADDLLTAHNNGDITASNAVLLSNKYQTGPIVILQAFCASRSMCCGHDVACALVDSVFLYAKDVGATNVFAQTADANKKGRGVFIEKKGFEIKSTFPDQKGRPKMLLQCAV